ncbi:type II toxin-antitoxin system RelE/ParE family toxin [Neorhizobium lilium]|uniref:Type II toxin-antitoxin system RelE/ParE family toxin n=1 Tax=Neorhizobium lilium TaxID=2503024 RepID=A0A444LMX9_9HYPH|nr:type II toxin-antitoxin system RelE/ParE family toxin [Neorhizobium lilium]RWX81717.1 type II toxin-antitoxin system RelE/ParE family toxin [Neorhizobium lilium]
MAYEIEFRPAAIADLQQIYLTIAREAGVERAGRYIDRIEAACMGLKVFPERGTVRNQIHPGLRIIGFERSVSIAFVVEPHRVNILRILPRGMNFPSDWLNDT